MATEHWFRWHHGTVTDPKWRVVANRASHAMSRDVTVGHVVSVWAAMLECASQANPRGTLDGWVDEDIAAALGMDEAEVRAIREAMEGKTLDQGELTGWKARQVKAEDRNAAARKRLQREREQAEKVEVTARDNGESHGMSRDVTECHDRGEERRGEKKEREASRSPTGSRLPADWALPDDWRDWARQERTDVDVVQEGEKFRDFWHAKAGKDGRKADWQATWRNWIRNARPSGNVVPMSQPGGGRRAL